MLVDLMEGVRRSPFVVIDGEADLVDTQQPPQHSLARRERSEHLCAAWMRECARMYRHGQTSAQAQAGGEGGGRRVDLRGRKGGGEEERDRCFALSRVHGEKGGHQKQFVAVDLAHVHTIVSACTVLANTHIAHPDDAVVAKLPKLVAVYFVEVFVLLPGLRYRHIGYTPIHQLISFATSNQTMLHLGAVVMADSLIERIHDSTTQLVDPQIRQ